MSSTGINSRLFNTELIMIAINDTIAFVKGMSRFDVRSILLERYKQAGYYREAKTQHVTRIGRCSRTGDIIEPMLRPQWQVSVYVHTILYYISINQLPLIGISSVVLWRKKCWTNLMIKQLIISNLIK
jgi:valyl-tRNA synthetase